MLPLVVEPAALAALIPDDRLLIVDLCRDETYRQYHLPGAVHISPSEIVSGERPAVGRLPPLDILKRLFSRIGYKPDLHIIAYDDEGGGWAGRFIWTLDVIGHQHSSYLNGGLIAWAGEKLPLTAEVPQIEPTEVKFSIHDDVIAEKEDVLAAIDSDDVLVWDARSPEEYAGTRVVAQKGGHVPGAINLDWLDLMDPDAGLRLRNDLDELLAQRGLMAGKQIITHCQTHHRSGLAYLVGKILGLDIRGYHGSWSEWGNDPDTPVETSAS